MYEIDTILELKNPQDPDDETGQEFPYNRVRVGGPSPINHGVHAGEWTGADGQGVILIPLASFGGNLDEPYGKVRALYNVVETPVHEAPSNPLRVINATSAAAGPTPEEVFAEQAPGVASEDGKRGRTPVSPLEDPRPKPSDGPLGRVHPEASVVDTGRSVLTGAE